MRSFSQLRRLFIAGCAVCCLATSFGAASAQTLRLITVGDLRGNDSSSWRTTIGKDVKAIRDYFERTAPEGGFEFACYEVDGDMATPNAIRSKISEISAGKDDTIVFYYSGHGANDPEREGQYLQLSDENGKSAYIFRSEVRDLLQAKGARLIVLITDCCNPVMSLDGIYVDSPKGSEDGALFHQLFYVPQGILDYTTSTFGQYSFTGKNGNNSLGTYALLTALNDLAQEKETVVTWKDVVVRATKLSDDAFQVIKPQDVEQKTQKPHVYQWPAAPRFGVYAKSLQEGGVRITGVLPDYPGEMAGFRKGDVIVSIAGKTINDESDYSDAIDAIGPDAQNVSMDYLRDGQKLSTSVPFLDAGKANPPAFGAGVRDGNVVSRVVDNSPAADAGLERGDSILKFNNAPIRTSKDFNDAVDKSDMRAILQIRKARTGRTDTVEVYLNKPVRQK